MDVEFTYKVIMPPIILPLSALGLLANSLSIWVWRACHTTQTPITLLFQYLALCDNVLLALFAAYFGQVLCGGVSKQRNFMTIMYLGPLFFSQTLTLTTTLTIAVCRWLAVWRPLVWVRLVTRRSVIVSCVVVVGWALLLTGLSVWAALIMAEYDTVMTMDVFLIGLRVVGLVLPLLALLAFSVSLLWMTHKQQRQQRRRQYNVQNLTLAVLAMTGRSLLAYPISIAGLIILVVSELEEMPVIMPIGEVLQVINSGINFVFYFCFASRFRELLQQRLRRLAVCACCRHQGQTTDHGEGDNSHDDHRRPTWYNRRLTTPVSVMGVPTGRLSTSL